MIQALRRRSDATRRPSRSTRWGRLATAIAASAVVASLTAAACGPRGGDDNGLARAPSADGMIVDTSSAAVAHLIGRAEPDAGGQLVNADSLKRQAIGALKTGDFDETATLLRQALELRPDDPALRQMDEWVERFQAQRQEIDADRAKAYERQIKDVKLLQENGYRSYAITAANAASSYAADKAAFASEPWLRELVDESVALGNAYEGNGEWLRAMRVWSDLAAIEELNPEWKARLKDATRRVRLLAVYAPDVLKELRDSTQAERDAVDTLLREDRKNDPDALAANDPADDPDLSDGEGKDGMEGDADDDAAADGDALDATFETDWHDDLRGINVTMMRNALEHARQAYVRPVEFQNMLVGGVDAVLAVAMTPGLERAFPKLEDAEARQQFVEELGRQRDKLAAADAEGVDRDKAGNLLRALTAVNDRTLALPEEVLISEFADGALSVLDPFTGMIWPSQVAEFKKGTQGNFVGVGIQIRSEDSGDLRVVSPLSGGPAEESGIKYGDVITRIDGKSAHGITDTQAVDVITGEPGTTVTLTIRSVDGTVVDHELVRRQINVRSVKGWRQLPDGGWDWMVDPDEKIGYLRLTNFQASSADELGIALRELNQAGATAVIFDLRYNPGGLLNSAVDIADRFLPNGVVVSTRSERDRARTSAFEAKRQADDVGLPMVVLVNEYSASASEIVSGAFKDLNRGLIVGKRTFGKGSVQMLYKLGGRGDDEAWLKLTTSKYYLPLGKSIHKDEMDTEWGVDPDVVVEMTPQQMNDAIRARQAMDVLRDDGSVATVKLGTNADAEEVDAETALLEKDAQLSAALLLLRMQLAGEAVL